MKCIGELYAHVSLRCTGHTYLTVAILSSINRGRASCPGYMVSYKFWCN